MAALEAAVALAEVDDVAVAVCEDLKLDMAGAVEVFFHINGVVAEGGAGLGAGDGPGFFELVPGQGDFHAAAAAACGCLDEDGVADAGGDELGFGNVGKGAVAAGDEGDADAGHGGFGGDLVAHHADVFGRGADEGHAVGLDHFGEGGVFGEEAVAGVDGVGAGDVGGGEDGGDVKVAVAGGRRSDADAFVGETDVHGVGVGGGVDGDGGDAELAACALNTDGDLAAVGDEDFLEHGAFPGSADDDEGLAVFDRLAAGHQNLGDGAGVWGFDLVEGFHGFDEEKGLAGADGLADVDEGGGAGFGGEVGDADHWAGDRACGGRGFVGGGGGSCGGGGWLVHGELWGCCRGHYGGADEAEALLAILQLNLGEPGSVQDGREALDGLGVECDTSHVRGRSMGGAGVEALGGGSGGGSAWGLSRRNVGLEPAPSRTLIRSREGAFESSGTQLDLIRWACRENWRIIMGRGILLWMLGVPIPIIIILALIWH